MAQAPFDANITMKQPLLIATEHLPTCQGCIQRACNHALGNEEVKTNDEILETAKFARDTTQLNRDLIQQLNDTLITLTQTITKANEAVEIRVKEEAKLEEIKAQQTALKAGVRVFTKGQKIATAVTTIVSSIIALIILL